MHVRIIIPNEYQEQGTHDTNMVPYQATIADIAGGFTATQAVGGWKDSQGKLIVESVTVHDINLERGEVGSSFDDRCDALRRLAGRIARELHQDCVYLEIDGEVELVGWMVGLDDLIVLWHGLV